MMNKFLEQLLLDNRHYFHPVIPLSLDASNTRLMDLSGHRLRELDLSDTNRIHRYIFDQLNSNHAIAGIGGYDEHRDWYRRSHVFKSGEAFRCIHLGVDIWMEAGTAVLAPMDSIIHSFADNDAFGNYGPTIILQHLLKGIKFYTLYGHLSKSSLEDKQEDQQLGGGEILGYFGEMTENGNWPPHLHFQVISDMLGNYGDFPGVCSKEEREYYLQICPDPNLILNITAQE